MVLLAGFANNPVVGYYKELGLTEIHNDILLASMGTVGSLMSAVCRPLWGVLADLTSIKTMAIVNFSLSSIFLAFWRGALLEGEALYYLFTVLLFSWVSGLPVMLVLTCQRYFGSAHQVANLSVLWTAMTLESCLLPLITPVTLKEYGWDGLLLFLTLTSIAGLLVSLWLPRERSSDVTKGSVPADKVHKCNTGS
ncbi:uncharacterized protein LOC143277266 [Babylonia areolata]|uniref:uncharacterized protein LOC143277266 n=1 Tax=Babylonia areolata TaxID=304850 RepID=UPI003FD4DFC4